MWPWHGQVIIKTRKCLSQVFSHYRYNQPKCLNTENWERALLVIKTNKTLNVSQGVSRAGWDWAGLAVAPLNGRAECGQTFESEIESCARPAQPAGQVSPGPGLPSCRPTINHHHNHCSAMPCLSCQNNTEHDPRISFTRMDWIIKKISGIL